MERNDPPESKVTQQASAAQAEPNLPKDLQSQLGHRLKAHYDTLLGEPVPDRFTELLGLLEVREAGEGLKAQEGQKR